MTAKICWCSCYVTPNLMQDCVYSVDSVMTFKADNGKNGQSLRFNKKKSLKVLRHWMPVRAVSKTFPLLFVLKWGKKNLRK